VRPITFPTGAHGCCNDEKKKDADNAVTFASVNRHHSFPLISIRFKSVTVYSTVFVLIDIIISKN
jgi:hypothetical protein